MRPNKISGWGQASLAKAGTRLVLILAGRWSLVAVIGLLLVLVAWLAYTQALLPLKEDVPLPPRVLPNNPQIDMAVLRSIQAARADRAQHVKRDFSLFADLFAEAKEQPED